MSAETFSPNGAEFQARPVQTTERGTEVSPSGTGNRIVDAANRVAGFLDRFKLGRREVAEDTRDYLEKGRQFLQNTGKEAVKAVVAGGEIALGVAILGGETAGRGLAKGGHAVMEGFRKADGWIETADEAIQEGVETAVDWTIEKGTEIKDTAVDRIEAIKSFFKDRAEAAKTRREARRAERTAAGKEATENSKEKFHAKARKRGHAALMAARAARLVYSANVAAK